MQLKLWFLFDFLNLSIVNSTHSYSVALKVTFISSNPTVLSLKLNIILISWNKTTFISRKKTNYVSFKIRTFYWQASRVVKGTNFWSYIKAKGKSCLSTFCQFIFLVSLQYYGDVNFFPTFSYNHNLERSLIWYMSTKEISSNIVATISAKELRTPRNYLVSARKLH